VLQEDFQNIELPQSYFIENETALANRTEYQLLEQSIKAQELQTKMKVGDYLPQLAVGATGYYYNSLIKDAKTTTNGLAFATISIPISDWWGGSYAIQEQKIKKEIAENTFSETKGLLKLQMEKGWMDVNVNYRQILIMEETVKQAEENLKVSKDGYNNGVVTLSELLEAQAIYTEITDKLIEAKTQYKLSITTYLQYTAR
jgi:outer membrane protein TolC